MERGIDKVVGEASIDLSEQWLGQEAGWRVAPFDAVQVMIGQDLVLTGYAVAYEPHHTARSKGVRLIAQSRTCDIVDCSSDIPSGQ